MQTETYQTGNVAAFMRSRDRYGNLSNMTFGFPLAVNGVGFQGPEGLYQALKFPNDPGTQRLIASQQSGMEAKKTAYRNPGFRPDWEEVKVQAMRYTLAVKLRQHPRRFGEALAETGDLPIVERSNRDPFWGARPQGNILAGVNTLGKLLTELRDTLGENGGDAAKAANAFAAQVPAERLRVNGRPVPPEVPAREARGPDGRDGANEANGSNDANRKNAPAPRAHRAPRAAGNRIQF
jgi:ribA/ribD-fused uncharacterized protein